MTVFMTLQVVTQRWEGDEGKTDEIAHTWTFVWKLPNRGLDARKEQWRRDSKAYRAAKKEMGRIRSRKIMLTVAALIWGSIGISMLQITKYFSIQFDKVLLDQDILSLDRESWRRKVLEALSVWWNIVFPKFEVFGRMDDYKREVKIDDTNAKKVWIYRANVDDRPTFIQLQVDDIGMITLTYRICDYSCSSASITILSSHNKRIWKIERGLVFFLSELKLDGEQKKFIADSLRKQ